MKPKIRSYISEALSSAGGLFVEGKLGRKKKRARVFYFDGDTQREPLRRREFLKGQDDRFSVSRPKCGLEHPFMSRRLSRPLHQKYFLVCTTSLLIYNTIIVASIYHNYIFSCWFFFLACLFCSYHCLQDFILDMHLPCTAGFFGGNYVTPPPVISDGPFRRPQMSCIL